MPKLLTKEELEKRFNTLYNGEYELISVYNGNTKPAILKHKICGKVYSVQRLVDFFNETGCKCPDCVKIKKLPARIFRAYSPENINIKLAALYGNSYSYVSGFVNRDSKCKFKCNTCNNIFEVSPHRIFTKNRFKGCPVCNPNKNDYLKNLNYLEDAIASRPDGNEYKWLEKYKGKNSIPIKIQHNCGYIWSIRPRDFKNQNVSCPKCGRKRSKEEKDLEAFIKSFYKKRN